MSKKKKFQSLEEGIILLQKEAKDAHLSIEEILHILSGKGRSLILILLSIPFCQPIQIPGSSIPFGIAIACIGIRIAFGKHNWLPKTILKKKVSSHHLMKITDKVLIIIRKIKRLLHPRLLWLCNSSYMEKTNGFMIFLLGCFLALPLPIPFSNITAAWAIFLIALGMLEDDGLFILFGHLFFLITIAVFLFIGFTAKSLFQAVL